MKENLLNFVTAAKIISQLPAGEIKNKAIDELFEKSLSEIGLTTGSYVYRKIELAQGHLYHFVFCSAEFDCEVIINATVGSKNENFTIVTNIS
jgi:hypothetical protein